MSLSDVVINYYDEKYDLNCSECMLKSIADYYDLNLHKQTIKAMASFGGGMGVESVCGAAAGAIAALGIMFTEERGHQSPEVKMMTIQFMELFERKLKTTFCNELKLEYKDKEYKRCTYIMIIAADALEEVVEINKDNYSIIR